MDICILIIVIIRVCVCVSAVCVHQAVLCGQSAEPEREQRERSLSCVLQAFVSTSIQYSMQTSIQLYQRILCMYIYIYKISTCINIDTHHGTYTSAQHLNNNNIIISQIFSSIFFLNKCTYKNIKNHLYISSPKKIRPNDKPVKKPRWKGAT